MNKFSYFKAPITNTTPFREITIEEYYNLIKSDEWEEIMLNLRKNSSQKNLIKNKRLDFIIPSGTFQYREKGGLIFLSNLICWDLDNLENLEEIKKNLSTDEKTLLIHVSPSGKGLKLFSKFNNLTVDNYGDCWDFGKSYFSEKYSIGLKNFDTQTKDISRACYVSWDKEAYYNKNAISFELEIKKEISSKKTTPEKEIINLILPYWKEGIRQDLAMSLAGFLRKNNNFSEEKVSLIISSICKQTKDSELSQRLAAVKATFKKDKKEIIGYTGLEKYLPLETIILLSEEEVINKYELKKQVNHLPYFENLDKVINLFGRSYLIPKKAVYYHIIGNCLKKHDLIKYQGLGVDTRVNLYFFLNSGAGKSNLKYAIKNTLPIPFLKWSEATSLHPEQLIGKMSKGKNEDKTPVEVPGYFKSDIVVLDEARQLFQSKELKHQEIRGYACIALDPFGKNEIIKQSVDFGSNHPLKYEANCSLVLFSQPLKLKKEIIESGFVRRGLLIGGITSPPIENVFRKRLEVSNSEEDQEIFSSFEQEIFEISENWDFENISEELIRYSQNLCNLGLNHSRKAALYVKSVYSQTVLDLLLKFSCIVAGATRKSKRVKKEDVEIAYMDLFEILHSTFDFLSQYSEDFYQEDMNSFELEILDWLFKRGATNEESSTVSINELKKYISNVEGITESAAIKRYSKLKEEEFISTKKGKHDSLVWISREKMEIFKGGRGTSKHYDDYLEICKRYKRYKEE
jgi:hypothetical protein